MSTPAATADLAADPATAGPPRTPWGDAWRRLRRDRLALVALAVVGIYAVTALAAEIGWIAGDAGTHALDRRYEDADWGLAWGHLSWLGQTLLTGLLLACAAAPVAYLRFGATRRGGNVFAGMALGGLLAAGILHAAFGPVAAPCAGAHAWTRHLLGGDVFGRNVWSRTLAGIGIAFRIGVVVTLMAIPVGVALGALAGYFGRLVDEAIVWVYTTLSSIPGLLLILAIGFALKQVRGIPDIYVVYFALGTTTWITLCRLIRGEVMKHKARDYVAAARALGAGHVRCIARHILPNVMHIVIIRFSLQFIFAIETEVILSYLGVGISDAPSWGRMIDDSKQELINGEFMNLAGATTALFGLALAFNIVGDALRDALDPRLKQ